MTNRRIAEDNILELLAKTIREADNWILEIVHDNLDCMCDIHSPHAIIIKINGGGTK